MVFMTNIGLNMVDIIINQTWYSHFIAKL